jgi:transglutaminase-like putative cysteine protease
MDDFDDLQDDYEDLQDDFDDLEAQYASATNSLTQAQAQLTQLQDDYDTLESEYTAYIASHPSDYDYSEIRNWEYHALYFRFYYANDYYWIIDNYSYLYAWKSLDHLVKAPESWPLDVDLANSYVIYDFDGDSNIDYIASYILSTCSTYEEYAEKALDFVHNAVYYMSDADSTGYAEYWKYPDETLYDGVGDCEDTTFLYASLLRAAGIPTIMLDFQNHLAVGVGLSGFNGTYTEYQGRKYYFAETTSNMYDEEDFNYSYNMQVGEVWDGMLQDFYIIEVY